VRGSRALQIQRRVALEVLVAVFGMAEAIAPSRADSQPHEYAESRVAEMVGSD
jgi:hypothetical protein